ncbi:DMT family transporter [Nocardioides caeni]|uniref:DMT family transporter n=1 Tax=Nocardioides caeni TaxID=574700 RepID=UPI0031EC6EBD
MTAQSSAIAPERTPLSSATTTAWTGLAWGFLGVAAFSLTVPLTRIAVAELSPLFIGAGRAVVAAALAGAALTLTRQRLPRGRQWLGLTVVGGGAVIGFPLTTSFALTEVPASHAAVVIALLPAVTAVIAVLRTGERTIPRFWVMAGAGALATVGFAATQSGALQAGRADLLLLIGVVLCAAGYAEGALLARELGPWQTISWGLVVASPVMLVLTVGSVVQQPPSGGPAAWACFVYVSVISMYLGFFAWYHGLAIGPMTTVSQVQLVQPVLSIMWAALLVGEQITWLTALAGLAVIGCAGGATSARGRRAPAPPS